MTRWIRPSLVLSIGDRACEMARVIQELAAAQLGELMSILAFVNVGSDGRIVRPQSGGDEELGAFEGLASGPEPEAFRANLDALLGANSATLLDLLKDLTRDIRSKEKIARLQGTHGLADSGRIFIYVLADTFGPLSSVFPLALLRLAREQGLGIATAQPLAVSLFLFLPDLFEEGRQREALLRSHATLSELEQILREETPGSRPLSWKAWVVGSVDRKGSAVEGFAAVVTPTSHFLRSYLDGVLDRDESWMGELSQRVNQRRTFLSSFGQASLAFPRRYLEETAGLLCRRRLLTHVLRNEASVDLGAVSGEVQTWIRQKRLTGLVEQLRAGPDGRTVYRDPRSPEVDPATLERGRFEQAVAALMVEDPEWGIAVQRAGELKLRELREALLEGSSGLVDEEGGLERGRRFADNLAGVSAGITEATVGIEVLNLENLILKLQGFFAKHAEIAGDPERLIELGRIVPGKIEAIERLTKRAQADQAREAELGAREAEARAKDEGEGKEEEDEEGGDATTSAPPRAEEAPSDAAKQETEIPGRPGEVAAASARAVATERLQASVKDLGKLKEELDALQKEQAEQRRRIAESRRLACDPTRRHLLLQSILARDETRRVGESATLGEATKERHEALDALRETTRTLRRQALIYLVLIPGLTALPLFLFLVVGWVAWLGILLAGALKVLPALRAYSSARSRHEKALRDVRLAAEGMWQGRLRELRLRFEFLLYAEATAVLESLQVETLAEETRLNRLQKLLQEASAAATRDWSEREIEDSIYRRTVIEAPQARALVEGDQQIVHATRETVDGLTLSQLLVSFRSQGGQALPAALGVAEEALKLRCREILAQHDLGSWLASELTERTQQVTNLWASVQTAASAWIFVDGEPAPGTLRKLVFYPHDLSPQLLKDCLQKETLEDGPIEWVKWPNRDDLSVCEMYVGFPSYLINEIHRPEVSNRGEIARFSAVTLPAIFSLAPAEDEIEVPEEEGYALIQAARAYLNGELSAALDSPAKLVAHFRKADFLPDDSLDELVSQLRKEVETEPVRRASLTDFIEGLQSRQRLQARKLMLGLV